MPHSYSQNVIHLVFSTKDRAKQIPPPLQSTLWAYIAGICQSENILVQAIGGTEDHLHLLMQVPATLAVARAVSSIKANSARWAHEHQQELVWQQGYASFSVSASLVPNVDRYIRNQAAHHQKLSFQQEFLALLTKHRVPFDAKFVFG